MVQLRLLERIRMHDPAYHDTGVDDARRLVESVKWYLQDLFNTRRGSSMLFGESGIPDFSEFAENLSLNARRDIEQQLREFIEKFEPRLSRVNVSFESSGKSSEGMRFRIDADIGDEDSRHVDFDTVVGSDGKIFLRDVQP
ncbi:MAG: type VI secretion system baseplate subunit TssE [Chlorobiales bacterium]|nr:type VI secretion system baseplate subunit TssE [Chlorobiales bacterium]